MSQFPGPLINKQTSVLHKKPQFINTDIIAGICTFPRLRSPSKKRHVMLNLTSGGFRAKAELPLRARKQKKFKKSTSQIVLKQPKTRLEKEGKKKSSPSGRFFFSPHSRTFFFVPLLGNRFRLVDLEEVEPLRKLVRQTLVPALALEV